MKRMTRILSLGLLLSISTVAMAGKGNDRNGYDGYHDNSGGQHHNARYDRRHYSKYKGHGNRHYVSNKRLARRHSHHGYYCYDRHPRGYVAPRAYYRYGGPEVVIVYQPRTGLYISASH